MRAATPLSKDFLEETFEKQALFESKSWKLSPLPWQLSHEQAQELEAIGQACLEFYKAQDRLYQKSRSHTSVLRNKVYTVPWVACYLDKGKPSFLLEHSAFAKASIPLIIRPDLLWTQTGWILTELDAVPGGVGLTAFLYQLYGIHSTGEAFLEKIWQGLCELSPHQDPTVAIVVSDESQSYRPEWEWISQTWHNKGRKAFCLHPKELSFKANGVYTPKGYKIDLVYRFFELFDWLQIPGLQELLKAEREGHLCITPPIKPHQEEKLSLALFHHPLLEAYWKEQLSSSSYSILQKIIPPSWIVDFSELPPGAYWHGPLLQGKPIHNYRDLRHATQRERNWILKISGFDETAWGARGLTLGSDVSQQDWEAALLKAQRQSLKNTYILQDYKKPLVVEHPVYKADGSIYTMQGRLRLCPYYLSDKQRGHYLGALATFCPKDKKIIHGMEEAALLPALS